MNFFKAQDAARRNTTLLVLLFTAAMALMIAFANLIALIAVTYYKTEILPLNVQLLREHFQWETFAEVTIAVGVIVLAGSLYKIQQLSEGGRVIAESLGGIRVDRNSTDPLDRKVLNVVEEMAIASSLPVPSVYLLDEEPAINAFAAGWTPGNAVIGITRGAVELLSREELQGVVAHEFSHISNGDMRFNIRLMGVLNGIVFLGILGRLMLPRRAGRSHIGSHSTLDMALSIAGLGFIVIGWIGTFLGNMIKAMVSWEREYLADASAVQFTRNKDGIAGALKKIGGMNSGSKLRSFAASEYSHALFASSVSPFMERFQTHPPLKDRIRRIDPEWNGKFIPGAMSYPWVQNDSAPVAARAVDIGIGQAFADRGEASDRTGRSNERADYASDLISSISEALKKEARDPYGVRALMFGLVIHSAPSVQKVQWRLLKERADTGIYLKTEQLSPLIATLDRHLRLPLIDLSTPALGELTSTHYQSFKQILLALMGADNKIDLGEWVIQKVLLHRLDETHGILKRPNAKYSVLGDVKAECELLLSMVAYAGHGADASGAARAFDEAREAIGASALKLVARKDISLRLLNDALEKLAQLKPLLKSRVLKACTVCAASGDRLNASGSELLRAVAVSMNCQ